MTSDSSSNQSDWPYINSVPPSYNQKANLLGDRYELLELIGRGATSRIYRARDRVLDRIVAVKLLREQYDQEQAILVARFNREARAVAALSNPHIVNIYDYGQHDGTYFIVMQYVDGTNLKDLLQREGRFEPAKAVDIIQQVLLALAAAHSHHLIHRDVKPQNILIQAADGAVKLTDFGVARALDDINLTTQGALVGTAFYMAPEQISGGVVSPATDLYAVGVVLFELLSGQLPFQGNNQMQVMLQHLYDQPPSLAKLGINVPPALEKVIQRALMKDPAQRYQSADEMRNALQTALSRGYAGPALANSPTAPGASWERTSPMVAPVAPPTNRKIPLWLFALLLLLGAGLIGLFFILNNHGSEEVAPTQQASLTSPTASSSANSNQTANATTVGGAGVNPTATPLPAQPSPVINTLANSPAPANPTPKPLIPTVTPLPTATAVPQTMAPEVTTGSATNVISPYDLIGSYKRNDGTLYGRPEVALYGKGSGYDQGAVNFRPVNLPADPVFLRLTGLDDERPEATTMQIVLNGTIIFDGPTSFPRVPDGDIGEGGTDRYWGQMNIAVPAKLLKNDFNTLVIRNTVPWNGNIGVPYILISSIEFVRGK